MKRTILSLIMATAAWSGIANPLQQEIAAETVKSNVVAEEGAWCWFADPRALHYENEAKTINATYLGYIDVHGNVMATQYDWLTGQKTDVLVRSYFQPDDHNNPTFLVLPDERVMIFYTRHTDEPKIWYRISRQPGDITALGEEKYLSTANNTTYPSPFILSDDPEHIYLCWRGINWHPTLARLTMPDAQDNCKFDFGPKQIVQSTGARPYAKYQSNGKDKIYLAYTTGHPDNEMPDWLYFNVIDINKGQGPILRDLKGTQLKRISDGVFNVSKTDAYAKQYPTTLVDNTANVRNWVWQIALDKDEHPVIAYPHIDDAKTSHVYWYARWTGAEWRRTWVQYGGHAFHQNWNQTERCYSGGMALDPDHINDLYLSIPTKNGKYNKDGAYEIWKYTIDDEGKVAASEQLTADSPKNNARPFVLPGSKDSKMRLAWMQGDYYYWMVNKNYPKGYPTRILCDHEWEEEVYVGDYEPSDSRQLLLTYHMGFILDSDKYEGTLFTIGEDFTYRINATTKRPEVKAGGKVYTSQNALYTSDDWANGSNGTNGDNHPTKLKKLVVTVTYDNHRAIIYRNGLVDMVIEECMPYGSLVTEGEGFPHTCATTQTFEHHCFTPMEVRELVRQTRISNPNLPTALVNGDFEGAYSAQQGSGVSSDRAIYVPEGWTVERTGGNENDLTALKSGDPYFSNFFASLAKPSTDSRQTYWIRQNWGTPTLTLSQEMRLPEGQYTLDCDVWKSGLGGDAYVTVLTEDGPTVQAPSLENKTQWQHVTLEFESDGAASTTVRLTAMHNSSGSEKIIGFDNVVLTRKGGDGIGHVEVNDKETPRHTIYDLSGRAVTKPQKGVYVSRGRKFVMD
ncbi:MAG: BNR-4 repeat-containing protein [Bacteroidaceae bacterium]|nr:BNR-4 repeat-containing protein [Bacteroidaceae bacterium]